MTQPLSNWKRKTGSACCCPRQQNEHGVAQGVYTGERNIPVWR
jgi:hypothetical protein